MGKALIIFIIVMTIFFIVGAIFLLTQCKKVNYPLYTICSVLLVIFSILLLAVFLHMLFILF